MDILPPPLEDASRTPTRWLDTDTLLRAQTFPQGAARAWLAACDQGFHPVRIDPAVIADLLDRLPTVLPGLTRAQVARYVQTIRSWTFAVTLVLQRPWSQSRCTATQREPPIGALSVMP